jgi:hypothetical protein
VDGARPRFKRLLWFVAIWAASVAALGLVGWVLRSILQ